jgi:hypothetical protein
MRSVNICLNALCLFNVVESDVSVQGGVICLCRVVALISVQAVQYVTTITPPCPSTEYMITIQLHTTSCMYLKVAASPNSVL